MREPRQKLLLETDWESLLHAYGSAADAPDRLLDLVSEDPAERCSALTYLWSALVHQSSVYAATPAIAGFLAALLPNEWGLDLQMSSMYRRRAGLRAGRDAAALSQRAGR